MRNQTTSEKHVTGIHKKDLTDCRVLFKHYIGCLSKYATCKEPSQHFECVEIKKFMDEIHCSGEYNTCKVKYY